MIFCLRKEVKKELRTSSSNSIAWLHFFHTTLKNCIQNLGPWDYSKTSNSILVILQSNSSYNQFSFIDFQDFTKDYKNKIKINSNFSFGHSRRCNVTWFFGHLKDWICCFYKARTHFKEQSADIFIWNQQILIGVFLIKRFCLFFTKSAP